MSQYENVTLFIFYSRWVSPSKANVFRSFEVILNYALQLHFEHTKFYPENAIGIFLLVAALIIMAYEKEAYKKFNSRFIWSPYVPLLKLSANAEKKKCHHCKETLGIFVSDVKKLWAC